MRSKRITALLVATVCSAGVLTGCNLRVATSGARCSKVGDYAQDRTYVLKCNRKKRWERGITVAFADGALAAILAKFSPPAPPSVPPTVSPQSVRPSVLPPTPITAFGDVTDRAIGSNNAQIKPGLYTSTTTGLCHWKTYDDGSADPHGTADFRGLGFLQIAVGDLRVTTEGGCQWTPAPDTPVAVPASGEGMLRVGKEIQPGVYRRPAGSLCFWQTDSGLRGTDAELRAIAISTDPQLVPLGAKDVLFQTFGCGTWTKLAAAPTQLFSVTALNAAVPSTSADSRADFTWLPADGPFTVTGTTAGVDISANGWTAQLRPATGSTLTKGLVASVTAPVGSQTATTPGLSVTGHSWTCNGSLPGAFSAFSIVDIQTNPATGAVTSLVAGFTQVCADHSFIAGGVSY